MTDTIRSNEQAFHYVSGLLESHGIAVASVDHKRPWGGFFVIADAATDDFMRLFFPDYSQNRLAKGLRLTPKILVVAPGKRLSWQYHCRREEIWSVVQGPVGVITSDTDEQSELQTVDNGKIVSFSTQVRHRLVGLDSYGIVAEFWKHTDAANPSDEDDIVRVADDFNR